MCKDGFNVFKLAMEEQTSKVERGQGTYINAQEMLENSKGKQMMGPTEVEMSSTRIRGNED